ncbi:hypothetical protein MNV49_004633 [Pseudohyphozyma bogoriensis]|nr:hypothetical protein MNV49_004633 [Pseudohyphozyma bogoriensis]
MDDNGRSSDLPSELDAPPPSDDELDVISSWSSPESTAVVLSSGTPHLSLPFEFHSPASTTTALPFSSSRTPANYDPLSFFANVAFYNPSPRAPLLNFNLSSLTTSRNDRLALAQYESEGYFLTVASSTNRTNWLFTDLFPYVVTMMSATPEGGIPDPIRQYTFHNLLRLCFIYRSNAEAASADLREECIQEARKHHHKASIAALQAKLAGNWQTEAYLIAFFVNSMADMLASERLTINSTVAPSLTSSEMSPFGAGIRDLVACYGTYLCACKPFEEQVDLDADLTTHFSLDESSTSRYVDNFFGISRRMLILFRRINKLVLRRAQLLATVPKTATVEAQELLIKAEAEQLVSELGVSWSWSEYWQEPGQTPRVQRGTAVFRMALRVMLLCELLDTDLADQRLSEARATIIELVADTPSTELAGYTWPICITAVYSVDKVHRFELAEATRCIKSRSYGIGFKPVDELLAICWDVMDREGKYVNGIAPWREALKAVGGGRNIYV